MSSSDLHGSGDKVREFADVTFLGAVTIGGTMTGVPRSAMVQQELEEVFRPEDWRAYDDLDTNLPSTLAGGSSGAMGSDDLHIDTPTAGSGSPVLKTVNAKKLGGITAKARRTFSAPMNYVAGQTLKIRVKAGMSGAIADQSATVDVSVYKADGEGGAGSDLVTTAATSINSVTFANYDFALTDTGINPGDEFDLLISVFVDDDSTEPTVIGVLGKVSALWDVKA